VEDNHENKTRPEIEFPNHWEAHTSANRLLTQNTTPCGLPDFMDRLDNGALLGLAADRVQVVIDTLLDSELAADQEIAFLMTAKQVLVLLGERQSFHTIQNERS
jgi:hypothetical protein